MNTIGYMQIVGDYKDYFHPNNWHWSETKACTTDNASEITIPKPIKCEACGSYKCTVKFTEDDSEDTGHLECKCYRCQYEFWLPLGDYAD